MISSSAYSSSTTCTFTKGRPSRSIRRSLSSRNANRLALLSRESQFDKNTILPFRDAVHFNLSNLRNHKHNATTHQILAPDWVRDEKDQSMYRILKFFIPAFIWAYNELKDALLVDEAVMAQSEALIAAHVLIINGEPEVEVDLEQFAPKRTRLEVGTAVSARSLAAWKNKAPALKHDLAQVSSTSGLDSVAGTESPSGETPQDVSFTPLLSSAPYVPQSLNTRLIQVKGGKKMGVYRQTRADAGEKRKVRHIQRKSLFK